MLMLLPLLSLLLVAVDVLVREELEFQLLASV
jgi:hypothetical protein